MTDREDVRLALNAIEDAVTAIDGGLDHTGELERRLELMWAWMEDPDGRDSALFMVDHPEAHDWFDKEGRVK